MTRPDDETHELRAFEDMVTPAPLGPSGAEPVFILGSVRSGTSAIVNALRDGAGLRGYREDNVPSLMQQVLDLTEQFFGSLSPAYLAAKDDYLISSVDPSAFGTWVRNYFAALYAVRLGGGRWVTKSPDSYLHAPMVRACRYLATMFPKARFVFCLRRGIENVLSRQKKFPEVPFEYHCQSWAHTIEEWIRVKPVIGDRALEVRQDEIATFPEGVARDLALFLDLSDAQRAGILAILQGPRVEQTRVATEHHPIALDETPWDDYQRADFIRFCLPAMIAAGFDAPIATAAVRAPVRLFFPFIPGAVQVSHVHPDWGFTEIDAHTFQIHPNEPGAEPAEVRWPGVVLDGESCLVADVSLGHKDSGPVVFETRVERSSDHHVCVEGCKLLTVPLGWQHCEQRFPSLRGPHDIVLSTRMAPGARAAQFAWARFRDVHLR